MALHIVEEATRCLGCKRPSCQAGCPIGTPIPHVIELFKDKRIEEAGALLFENNPMSLACAVVCNHGAQCEGHCVLGRKDTSIRFSSIERYVSDAYLDRLEPHDMVPNGREVAIVGSGPAGLTAAFKLTDAGCGVTMFEQRPKVGGLLEYGIPAFRLSKSIVLRYRSLLEGMGVKIRPNTTIGGTLHIDDLLRDGYDSVLVVTGAQRARKLDIHGEARGNVYFGIDYLADPDTCEMGRDVAIIGVGNVAMDVARTALRHGAKHVTLYSNTDEVSASSDQVEYAELEGAQIVRRKSIVLINENGPVFRQSILGSDGRLVGLGDELEQVDCDTVIIAVSQVPKDKLVLTTEGLKSDACGLLEIDENCQTTVPGVFAAGDVVQGPLTVVNAAAGAKRAVAGMLRYMGL